MFKIKDKLSSCASREKGPECEEAEWQKVLGGGALGNTSQGLWERVCKHWPAGSKDGILESQGSALLVTSEAPSVSSLSFSYK